jgi:uncharacterized protein
MSSVPQEIRNALIAHDAELQRLAAEHSQCESQIEELQKQSYLSAEDLIREVELKKIKLRLKDQMEKLLHERSGEWDRH